MATTEPKKHSKLDPANVDTGLKLLYEKNKDTTNVDIVAIPGLGANPLFTWGTGEKDRPHWLKDIMMLPHVVPDARIMGFQYESQWFGEGAINQRLAIVVDQLLAGLNNQRKNLRKRPLIFIGHCLGGLILLKMLIKAELFKAHESIFVETVGCLFLGTPFKGTKAQSKATAIASIAYHFDVAENSPLLQSLKPESEAMNDAVDDFVSLANQNGIPLFCFFESKKSDIAKVASKALSGLIKKRFIVDEESGTIVGHPKLSLDCDHFQLNKFTGPEDNRFILVSREIEKFVHDAPNKLKARQKTSDDAICNGETYEKIKHELWVTKPEDDLAAVEGSKANGTVTSGNWVFDDVQYRSWEENPRSAVLWIHGGAGRGKAITCVTIIRHLQDMISQKLKAQPPGSEAPALLLAYFFFDKRDTRRDEPVELLKTLIWQLIDQKRPLVKYLLDEWNKQRSGTKKKAFASMSGLFETLSEMLKDPSIGTAYLVVCGLDEALDDGLREFLGLLERVIEVRKENLASKGKFLLFSQANDSIRKSLNPTPAIDLEDDEHQNALDNGVRQYITAKVRDLAIEQKYPGSVRYIVEKYLQEKSQGNYTWVDLACLELQSDVIRPTSMRRFLDKLPRGIDDMYRQILERVFNNPDEDMAEYAKEILRCMIVVFQPPTIQELAVLADLPKSCHGDIPKLEKYIRLCGSFIDIVEAPDSTQTVSFIHQSAKDFLQASSTDLFAEQSEAIQHGIVALRCVEHITGQQVTILGDLKDEHESSDEESSNSAAEETENDDLEGSEAEDDECLPEILEVLDNKHAQVTHEVIPEESMEEIGGLVKDLKSVVQGVEEPTIYRPASLAHIDPYFQPPAVLNMESSLSYTQIPDREFLAGMSNIDESQATNNSSFDQKPYGARSQPQWLNQQFTIPPSPITESERSFSFTPTPVDLHMDVARTSSQNSIRVDPFIEDRVSPLSEPQTCDTSSSSSNAAIPLQHSLSRLSRSGAVKRRSILFNEADELTQNPSISDRRRSSLGIRRFSRQQERQVSGDPVEYVSSETGSIGKNEGHLEFGSQSPTFPQDQPRTPSHAAELADTSFTPQHQQYQEHINSPKPIVKRKPLPARIPVSPNNRPPLQVNMPSYGPSDLHLRGGGGGPMSDDGHEDNDNLSEYDYDHETLLYPVLYWMRHAMAATSDLVEIFDLADQFWSEKSDARSKWWESFVDASRSGSTVSGLSDFSPLHVACYLGYTDLVKRLVKEGGVASLSVPDSWGHCPLYWAAFRDNVNSAIILLEAGADVNATQRGKKDGIAALYGAADAGNLEMVRCLLKNGSTVDVENEDYGTALYIASENGHLDVVQELLSCNAKINSAGGYYKRPITGAAYYEQDEIVQELLKHKPEIIPDDESRYGNALQTAAHEGVELIVQMLLDYGVNIDIKGGHYDYAIAAAASEKKDDIVGLLLTRNPCVESLNEAIFRAAQVGDEDVVRLVLEEFDKRELSPSFTSRRGNSLVSPAQNGYVEVLNMLLEKSPGMALINEALYEASVRIEFGAVEALLNAGADPNSEDEKAGSALGAAAFSGSEDIVNALLEKGADPNPREGFYGNPIESRIGKPLQAVAYWGYENLVHTLIDSKADVNATGGTYGTALIAAAIFGRDNIVDILLKHGADINAQSEEHGTALIAAATSGYSDVADMLILAGADINIKGGPSHTTALIAGSEKLHLRSMQLLLEKGANVNEVDDTGRTALFSAALSGDAPSVQLLLDHGADVMAKGGDMNNVLQYAAKSGNVDCVKLILEKGVHVNILGGYYETALQAAAASGNDECVAWLLENHAEVNIFGGYYGCALQAAAWSNSSQVVETLLAAGANPNITGGYYQSALQAAAESGIEESVKALLGHGANVNELGGFYGSPLVAATVEEYEDLVKLLCDEHGADPHAQGGHYGNALQAAVVANHIPLVKYFLGKECDVNARGGKYDTALQAACFVGTREIVDLLLEKGADVNLCGAGFYGSPLGAAVVHDDAEIIQLLLNKNAMAENPGLLGLAVQYRSLDGVKKLVKHGASEFEEALAQLKIPKPPRSINNDNARYDTEEEDDSENSDQDSDDDDDNDSAEESVSNNESDVENGEDGSGDDTDDDSEDDDDEIKETERKIHEYLKECLVKKSKNIVTRSKTIISRSKTVVSSSKTLLQRSQSKAAPLQAIPA